MFAHEQLDVYRKTLDFASKSVVWTSTWPKKHALVDHLSRASESIVLNLAEAARQCGAPARLRIADYAIGSSLECAACLDLARIKDLLSGEDCWQGKRQLCDITNMLIGQRKAWSRSIACEEPPGYSYSTRLSKAVTEPLCRGQCASRGV